MPTYEYRCDNCGYNFEKFQNMSETPVLICAKCGGTVRRVISGGTGIIFKGSGFHITDYGRSRPTCGRNRPCCGRETPCEKKPCEDYNE